MLECYVEGVAIFLTDSATGSESTGFLMRSISGTELKSAKGGKMKVSGFQNDNNGRGKHGALVLLVLLSSWFLTNCMKPVAGGEQVGDFKQTEAEFDDARFELRGLPSSFPSVKKARGYWVKEGDLLAAAWLTYEFHWTRVDKMCAFGDNNSSSDCLVCNYCASANPGGDCPAITGHLLPGVLTVARDPSFMLSAIKIVDDYQGTIGNPRESCSTPQNPSQRVIGAGSQPLEAGLYKMTGGAANVPFKFSGEAAGEAKVHVVKPGQPEKVAYQMQRIESDENGTIVSFWKWEMPDGDYWDENFSPRLSISRVRILRGTCADGSAQGVQCLIPNEAFDVKPSKLLFWTSFNGSVGTGNEGEVRCYPGDSPIDGAFIDLIRCRVTADPAALIARKELVPTYELFRGYIAPSPPQNPDPVFTKVTWLARFNTSENAPSAADANLSTSVLDQMPDDAPIIIEFTLEAN